MGHASLQMYNKFDCNPLTTATLDSRLQNVDNLWHAKSLQQLHEDKSPHQVYPIGKIDFLYHDLFIKSMLCSDV